MTPRWIALAAIRVYQRWLSPHKGFRCAYRVHTGCASCSTLGYRVIRRFGLATGLGLLWERTQRCGAVHAAHRPAPDADAPRRMPAAQRGDCDLGCVPDLPCDGHHGCAGCGGPGGPRGNGCGLSPCDCCSCDWPRRGNRGAQRYADRHGLRQRRRR